MRPAERRCRSGAGRGDAVRGDAGTTFGSVPMGSVGKEPLAATGRIRHRRCGLAPDPRPYGSWPLGGCYGVFRYLPSSEQFRVPLVPCKGNSGSGDQALLLFGDYPSLWMA